MGNLTVVIEKLDLGLFLCFSLLRIPVEFLLNWFGPVFIAVAVVLISAVAFVHVVSTIPYYYPHSSLAGGLNLLVSAFLYFNIFWNYFMVIYVPPGTPPTKEIEEDELDRLEKEPVPTKGQGFSKFCKNCRKPKPPRAHHCHICKQCVLKMDHHCPWISNCVGFGNHKFFFLFLFYMFVGSFYVVAHTLIPFLHPAGYPSPWAGMSGHTAVALSFVLALAIGLAVGVLMCWHLYLIFSSQTTIEFYYNRFRKSTAELKGEVYHNEYDLGMKKNWEMFFGPGRFWFSWMLPSTSLPPGDGLSYPSRKDHFISA